MWKEYQTASTSSPTLTDGYLNSIPFQFVIVLEIFNRLINKKKHPIANKQKKNHVFHGIFGVFSFLRKINGNNSGRAWKFFMTKNSIKAKFFFRSMARIFPESMNIIKSQPDINFTEFRKYFFEFALVDFLTETRKDILVAGKTRHEITVPHKRAHHCSSRRPCYPE
jgi:hypothetical protein